jgi:uncharacterized protein YggE
MKFLAIVLTTALAVLSVSVLAASAGRGSHIGWKVHQPTRFMVSGVLKKDGTADTIKLVHEIDVANSTEDAVAALTKNVGVQYKLKSVEFSPKFLGLKPTVRRCLSTFA